MRQSSRIVTIRLVGREFLSAAAAQNLRKLAKLIPLPARYSPHEAERPGCAR